MLEKELRKTAPDLLIAPIRRSRAKTFQNALYPKEEKRTVDKSRKGEKEGAEEGTVFI